MAQVNLQIDGRSVSVAEGKTILQACRSEGIEIPHLCYSDDLPANSTCRLCVVEVDGANNLVPSCSAQVTPNMVVSTNSERVAAARKLVLELLMSDHPADCLSGTNGSACELERYAREFGLATTRYLGETHDYEVDESSPFFTVDLNRVQRHPAHRRHRPRLSRI